MAYGVYRNLFTSQDTAYKNNDDITIDTTNKDAEPVTIDTTDQHWCFENAYGLANVSLVDSVSDRIDSINESINTLYKKLENYSSNGSTPKKRVKRIRFEIVTKGK